MSQREDMRKNPFWDFWFDRLWPFNFQFGCQPKSSNHIILVSAHLIWKLKIVPESSWSRESMVRNPFWDFECFTSINPCDSLASPRATFWPVTSEKFSRHGFSVFHLNFPFSLESRSIREGEESQEDSLKIRSDENFPEALLLTLRSFLLDLRFSCESELSKFLNSQTW